MIEAPGTRWTALLGRWDEPTDGVRDYCNYLAEALLRRGIELATFEATWGETGWAHCMWGVWRAAGNWKGRWVLLQYTALAWSRRGFPFGALLVLLAARWRGARIAVVFHDWTGYPGLRWIDRIRRACQVWTMRQIAALADRSIFPVPPERAHWLEGAKSRAVFIPIGANLPTPLSRAATHAEAGTPAQTQRRRTVAVFGVTEGERGLIEADRIAEVLKPVAARLPKLRLVVMGRGSEAARDRLERGLEGAEVEMVVLGVLPAEQVADELAGADALLFVRGELQGQRGSAVAGIACGLPVIGFGSFQGAFPLTEGGTLLAPLGDGQAMAEALEQVLTDENLRRRLRNRSLAANAEYFSWSRIAERFMGALTDVRA